MAGSASAVSWVDWAALLGFPVLLVLMLARRGEYQRRFSIDLIEEGASIVIAVAVSTLAVLTIMVLFGSQLRPSLMALPMAGISLAALLGARVVFAVLTRHRRRTGHDREPLLIVGAGLVGNHLARRLHEEHTYGVRAIGCVDDDPIPTIDTRHGHCPVLGGLDELPGIIRERAVRHVLFSFSSAPDRRLMNAVRCCEAIGARVYVVPRMFDAHTNRATVQHVGGMPVIALHRAERHGWEFAAKHAMDRVLAALGLTLLAPLMAAIALAVWLDDRGPVIYRQRRVGRDGCRFDILKFRTMRRADAKADVANASTQLGRGLATGGVDPSGVDRRTRIGRLLRRTSLDELPQLINVLRGEMSLVGPRPERSEVVEFVERDIARYGERHRVKSGLTGWAQVHGLRGVTSLADRAEFDNYYIENWSLWLDLKILLLTVRAVVGSADA